MHAHIGFKTNAVSSHGQEIQLLNESKKFPISSGKDGNNKLQSQQLVKIYLWGCIPICYSVLVNEAIITC